MPSELPGTVERSFGVAPKFGPAELGLLAIAYDLPVMRTSAV